jgi:stage II sporulation protein P
MINLAVINIKDIFKIIKRLIILVIVIVIMISVINTFREKIQINLSDLKIFYNTKNIDRNLSISSYFNSNNSKKENGLKKILVSELTIFSNEEKLMEKENQEEDTEFENSSNVLENQSNEVNIENNQALEIATSLPTNVISTNNKTDTFTDVYNSVKIKNESQYSLTEDMVIPNVDFSNKKDIIIYHTHTCESYTPTEENNYEASGNFRTTDLNYSVARVGTELTNNLQGYGFNVNHNTTYHDYPAYTGSYTRALSTIKSLLNTNPNTELVIDLHRDAIGSSSTYAPCVQIGDEVVAQIMFVIGTDGGGLEHKDWLNNFKLAIKIQEKANEMYPGLFKPIILRDSRYNQHVAKGACIIEVGATGNTLEQCNGSMKYLANVISEVMK